MSAHLQFGPEWMRKGPGKTSTAVGASSTGEAANASQDSTPASITSPVTSRPAAGVNSKRHPSLGNLSASGVSFGATALSPSATTPSPGAFSFAAAAAQAGSTKDTTSHSHSHSSSSSLPHSSDGDSARYSKRLLSLYSSERGGKNSTTSQAEIPRPASPGAGQKKKSIVGNTGGIGTSDRDARRMTQGNTDGTVLRPHSPTGEPRGLNARTIDKTAASGQRPGLFQRGSNHSVNTFGAAPSQTTSFPSRDRDRHGAGIQGGVLSGVAAPLSSRRRKESEAGGDNLRSPRTHMDGDHQWDQRRTNDAFTSARNRSNRTTAPDSHVSEGNNGAGSAPNVTSNGEVIETWSRFGGRRERAPGEGPIGPPADHSGGFARFSGYDRKRERQTSMAGPKRSTEALGSRRHNDEGQGSSDTDLSKHATYVLDSLRLDDEEEVAALGREHNQQAEVSEQQHHQLAAPIEWSPESQDWLYRDPSGQVQGPFKANLMQDWYAAKYFSNDLLVRRVEDEAFISLGEKLLLIGNMLTPFLIPPFAYAMHHYEEPKTEPIHEQPTNFQDPSLNMFHNQQHLNVGNPLGWPGNLDVLNHFGGGSGHSSPFATPQGHFAELDGNNRSLRQRTQQDQYAEMMRQRELAEQRAIHEQRTARMAAMSLQHSQGRDPAALGMWGGAGSMMGGEWNQASNQPQTGFVREEDMRYQQLLQQQQYEQQQHGGQAGQSTWDQQPQFQNYSDQQTVAEESVLPEHLVVEDVAEPEASRELVDKPTQELAELEIPGTENVPEAAEDIAVEADETEEGDGIATPVEEEQAPEQVWPQSPSAVEFASEPLMSEEQWSKGESPNRGKKSRRDKVKQQKTDEDVKQEKAALARNAGTTSGNVKTMTEEQFRRSQASTKDSFQSTQAPLSSWLPDTPTSGAPTKAAPWANSQQEGSTATGLSLREIQEAEARQAETRKAARQRLQLNTPLVSSSGDSSLPATMSWGLASSHSANNREGSTTPSSATNTAAPAWNARQAPKKTLTEIQEEERARAQTIKKAQASQSELNSKGYADSASKSQQSNTLPSSTNNGAASSWSVVGSGGKPSTPTTVLARPSKVLSAPAVQRSTSNSGGTPAWQSSLGANGGSNNSPTSKVQTPRKSGNGLDGATPPSSDFIRHCKDQLKGLNVKVDDFIEMLLSFPLDPSPEVVEIIAESVYASSNTLDGRRFAADFVAKRKLDAQTRGAILPSKGSSLGQSNFVNGQVSPSTVRSASDVLKSSPSTNDGFGGFKVVKAKGTKRRT